MSNITIFLTNNIGVLVALLAVIFGLVKAIISKNKQKIYTGIYDLIGNAELLYNNGPEKFDYVFKNAYNKVPKMLRFLISEEDVRRAIEYSLNKLQAYAILQNKTITDGATTIPAAQ
ncbi:hypothetical protein G9F73_012455 [Clostridium estertheticum]|uniref:hypothetical protein n=1 Tax=Clostridium estertheticum TaxID=238834 RepID=UPI0013EE73EB|nr:hypothetical protein [Clostridium estertheticum]MBZ9608620.1 hypothetical protein [Clostridium estertheticum]